MKKVLYSLFALAMTAMTFTSCEDVPEPYDIPGTGEDVVLEEGTYLDASFSGNDGGFVNANTKEGSQEWVIDSHGYAKGTGHISNDVPKVESQSYFISPEISLDKSEKAYLQFDYILRYVASGTENKVFLTSNYTGNPATTNWVDVTGNLTEGRDWENWSTYKQSIPEQFIGQEKVRVAFYFACTTQNASTWEIKNVVVKEGEGSGADTPTEITEVTCAKAVELTNALGDNETSEETYAVTGYITEVSSPVSNNQQIFWMADTKDGGKVFEAYYANLPEGVSEFKKGSKVKITGNLMKYVKNNNVTPEMKNPDVVILEEANGDPDPQPTGKEVTCAEAAQLTNALNDGATSTDVYSVIGFITEVVSEVSRNQQSFWMADTKDGGKVFEAYWANLPEGVSEFKTGLKVKITGNLMKYVKDGVVTPEIKNATVEILEENGNDTPAGNVTKAVEGNVVTLTVPDTQEDSSITVDLNTQGWESNKAVNPATITLSDGTTVTFAKGDGSNTPAYYDTTKGVRVYAKNTITISGKAVAKVVMKCDTYNNTDYIGNSQLYATASGTTFTICNDYTENKGGLQLRVQTITITYAK